MATQEGITIGNLRAEIDRLQEAKRRALAIADERGKENVGVKLENERLRAALEKAEPFLAAAAYTEQSSPPYQQGRACGALTAVRDALAKPQESVGSLA